MPKPPPSHDWYLVQWCEHMGKRQSDLVADLDWNGSKASLMWKGKQRYHRDDVNQVAAYLGIEPFELLMHPADANAIKQFRIAAGQIATVKLAAESEQMPTLSKRNTTL